jgi:putative transposase
MGGAHRLSVADALGRQTAKSTAGSTDASERYAASRQLYKLGVAAYPSFSVGPVLRAVIAFAIASFRSRAALQFEILAFRHQIGVLQRSVNRPKLTPADRFLWTWLCCIWKGWQSGAFIMKAATVVGWHRRGFRLFWSWKIRRGKLARPAVPKEVRELIGMLSRENPLWGAPHIHGELLKLGIHVGETSTWSDAESRPRRPGERSSTII